MDSAIIVSSLLANEPRHKGVRKIWNNVFSGENPAIMLYSVFGEVVSDLSQENDSVGDQTRARIPGYPRDRTPKLSAVTETTASAIVILF